MTSKTYKRKKNISSLNPVVRYNGKDNLTPYMVDVLNHLKETNALSDIVKLTGRQKPNIHKTLKKLILKGFVKNKQGLYFLTSYGCDLLNEGSCTSLDGVYGGTTGFKKFGEKIRLHDVSFTLKFWSVPEGWSRLRGCMFGLDYPVDSPLYNRGLGDVVSNVKNNPSFVGGGLQSLHIENYTVIVYASSVRVFVPEVVEVEPSVAVVRVWESLINFIPKLERLLKIPSQCLWSEGRLNIKISTSHYALFKSAFAEYIVRDKGETRFLVKDSLGVARLLVDRSNRSYETESINPGHGLADIEIIKEFNRQLIEGEGPLPKDTKEALDVIGSNIEDVSRVLTDFSIHLSAHTGTAKANLVAAESLNRALDRLDFFINFIPRLLLRFMNLFNVKKWKIQK